MHEECWPGTRPRSPVQKKIILSLNHQCPNQHNIRSHKQTKTMEKQRGQSSPGIGGSSTWQILKKVGVTAIKSDAKHMHSVSGNLRHEMDIAMLSVCI